MTATVESGARMAEALLALAGVVEPIELEKLLRDRGTCVCAERDAAEKDALRHLALRLYGDVLEATRPGASGLGELDRARRRAEARQALVDAVGWELQVEGWDSANGVDARRLARLRVRDAHAELEELGG